MNVSAVFALALAATAGTAWQNAASNDITSSIESCVSQGVIRFAATDQRVALQPDDQARVQAEMEKRYPVLVQHGFPVSKIILWHKAGGESVFITLLEHPSKPNEACFTATFAAARFSDIGLLRRKYLRPEQVI